MALHATSWPFMGRGSMTTASSDLGITEATNEQRQPSNSHDREWASFLDSLNRHDQDTSSSNTIPLGQLALDDNMPVQFGAMDGMMHTDPLPLAATTTSSAPPPIDSNNTSQHYSDWQQMPMEFPAYDQTSAQWVPVPQQQQQHHLQPYEQTSNFMQGGEGLGIQMAPTSHPAYPGPFHYDQPFLSQESPLSYSEDYRQDVGGMWNHHDQSVPPQDDLFADDDEAEPEDSTDPCYAQLLHRCLKEAPGHTMSLRELYDWVSQHSQKAKDLKNRGWQNSVRHNLSMNAAFQRVPHSATSGPKKGSLWRLTDDALRMGVISTTRYRKDPKRKSDRRSATPALNRQASGARGGRATRDATRLRQQHRNGGMGANNRFRRSERSHTSHFSPYSSSPSPGMPPTSPHGPSPYFFDLDMDEASNFPLPMTGGQTSPPQAMMMFDDQSKPVPQSLDFMQHRPVQQSLEFLPLEYGQGNIYSAHDAEMMPHHLQQHAATPTPSQASYMTDTSFMTDDNVPALLMSACNQDSSRETTTFQ